MNYNFQKNDVLIGFGILAVAFVVSKINFMAGIVVLAIGAIYAAKVLRDTFK